jgi:hypothetical protein
LLILGLVVPWLLRLVSEEVGARKTRLVPGAVFCLCAMAALWGLRDFAHRRALSILDSHTYSGENPERLSALPVPLNPFTWTGVAETSTSFHLVRVNALDVNALPEEIRTFDKPEPAPAIEAAMRTPTGKIFMDFARFPWAQVEENEEGFLVSLRDLRFFHPSARSPGFTLEVELDKRLQLRSETFYFSAPPRGRRD